MLQPSPRDAASPGSSSEGQVSMRGADHMGAHEDEAPSVDAVEKLRTHVTVSSLAGEICTLPLPESAAPECIYSRTACISQIVPT